MLALGAAARAAPANSLSGRWAATATLGQTAVPFRLDLVVSGEAASGTFFDGDRPTNPSRSGDFKSGHLHLVFPSYAAALDADLTASGLEGAYVAGGRSTPIHAVKALAPAPSAKPQPNIAGEWIIPYKSPKGESAWRLIIQQRGGRTQAAILRIDGDTGTLNGGYMDGAYHLSHFAGERGATLDITPDGDQLKLVLADGSGRKDLTALRPPQALAIGAEPSDPRQFTFVQNPAEPFKFDFPDLSGQRVANTDARFKHKVVIIDIMGSWCPNCHDEAPFLQALYTKYHKRGLEVVALDFEQPDQLADPQRLRAFIVRYGLQYTVLLAGEPREVKDKLPQAVNLNAWPTTFFVGRDGLVKSAHVGFTSPGSGPRDTETRSTVERQIQTLLER